MGYVSKEIRVRYGLELTEPAKITRIPRSSLSERGGKKQAVQSPDQLQPKHAIQVEGSSLRSQLYKAKADSGESESDDCADSANLPNLTLTKEFMLSGKPFENLRRNLEQLTQSSSQYRKLSAVERQDKSATLRSHEEPLSIAVPMSLTNLGEARNTEEVANDSQLHLQGKQQTIRTSGPEQERMKPSPSLYLLRLISWIVQRLQRYWEPRSDEGKVRIGWVCRCGVILWDDYKELRPGAADDLRKSLEAIQTAS